MRREKAGPAWPVQALAAACVRVRMGPDCILTALPLECLRGEVVELRTYDGLENFVLHSGDRAMSGAAAVGLAVSGLAWAATGALIGAVDASERVTYFHCLLDGTPVFGRFGEVTFQDGDRVSIAGARDGPRFIAYAVARPSDRTIWMSPHCSRGTSAFLATSLGWTFLLSWIVVPATMFAIDYLTSEDFPPLDFWIIAFPVLGIFFSAVCALVAWRFRRFARLSDDIFTALSFEAPRKVCLPRLLRLAKKSFKHEDHLRHHPHARWVFKY